MVSADQKCQPARRIEDVRKITEQFVLIGVVVNWIGARCRIFDADPVVKITFRGEDAQFSKHTSVLHALFDRIETSTIQSGFALLKHRAIFGVDVDYACGTETELSRKRTGDERDAIGKTGFQFLTEA